MYSARQGHDSISDFVMDRTEIAKEPQGIPYRKLVDHLHGVDIST